MTDPIDTLTTLRPEPTIAPDWADSSTGQMCLQRARASASADVTATPRTTSRRKPVFGAGAAVVLAAGAATAFGFATRAPADAAQVMCFRTASIDGDAAGYTLSSATPQAALDQCRSHWTEAWPGDATPVGFAVCVYPVRPNNDGGAQVVIPLTKPADATSCQIAGFSPIG